MKTALRIFSIAFLLASPALMTSCSPSSTSAPTETTEETEETEEEES